jgi:hypothetical protein
MTGYGRNSQMIQPAQQVRIKMYVGCTGNNRSALLEGGVQADIEDRMNDLEKWFQQIKTRIQNVAPGVQIAVRGAESKTWRRGCRSL